MRAENWATVKRNIFSLTDVVFLSFTQKLSIKRERERGRMGVVFQFSFRGRKREGRRGRARECESEGVCASMRNTLTRANTHTLTRTYDTQPV